MNEGHNFCFTDEWRQMLEELVFPPALADVVLGDDVIEIGPGAGFVTDELRQRAGHVTAIEIDPLLATPLADRLAGTNVDVLLGDGSALDLPDGRFSAAVCFNMLHHVPTDEDQDRMFSELARVLRAGAALVAVDGVDSEGTRLFHEGDNYNPIDPDALPGRLTDAGFTDIDVELFDLGWICHARSRR